MTDDDLSNAFVKDAVALSPLLAVYLGMPSDGALDDLSPDGLAEQATLATSTLAAADAAPATTDAERVAREVLVERLAFAPRPLRRR